MMNNNIVIAGAGLIGLSFALCMKNQGLSIQIVETHLPEIIAQSQQTHSRPISLSFGSVCILKKLGVWEIISAYACPILSVHVSEQGRFGFTAFSAAEQKVPALGYVIPFAKLQSALYQAAANAADITITSIHSIEKIKCDSHGAFIKTNHTEIQSDLFIAADGTHSTCRDLLGISFSEKNNGDVAHIYQLQLSENHDHIAYERFTKYGVLAILPLHEKNKAQLVWTMTPRNQEKWKNENEKIILFLQNTFEGRISIIDAKKIAEFSLKTIIADKQIMPSGVLLGNAAHTIYPVAAQGFNLGLQDVALLGDILIHAKKNIGDLSVLEEYETKAMEHQRAIFKITDELTTLFELPLIGNLRGLGLLATDLISPIKNKLAKRTMGLLRSHR